MKKDNIIAVPSSPTGPLGRPTLVRLTASLVPLLLPVQEACYPAHLHEESDSFLAKVAASPTTSFVCLKGQFEQFGGCDATNTKQEEGVSYLSTPVTGTPTTNTATAARAVGYLVALPSERFQAPALDSNECAVPVLPCSGSSRGEMDCVVNSTTGEEEGEEGASRGGTADTLYLHDMAVLPEARGTGVAQALLAVAYERQAELNLDRLALIAVQGADTYWTRHGFRAVDPALLPPCVAEKLLAYGEDARYMETAADSEA